MKVLIQGFTGLFILASLVLSLNGCKSDQQKSAELSDTPDRGTINISADESFKPIIDAQVQVYEANHPGTHIAVQYKPEAETLKDFAVDSIRLIVATRGYNKSEESFMVDSMRVGPAQMVIARDAIAVIVNPLAPDSAFSMPELKDVLMGRFKKNLIPVFDGVQATSTVRYIVDSVLHSDSLSPKAIAARTSQGVIDYVANHPEAVGFIGVSWIGNKEDTSQLSFLKKVKIARLESRDMPGKYVLPIQLNIYMESYPMVRDLVYILKENFRGLGHGFSDFLSGEIGQLIFKRAYLVPVQRKFTIREIQLRE
ncbi:MAG TPA: substrate-binding domain-containing protein [Chitinophagaceae bacterium]|nr:substrate-binding domain-containing protein [Chitinophagaceae bacterium]